MNAQQAQILLEKINALWRSMNVTPGAMSAIERDLMLSYIRQLYEVFLNGAPAPAPKPVQAAPAQPQARNEPPKPAAPQEIPVERPAPPAEPAPQPAVQPPPQVITPPPPKPQPSPQAAKTHAVSKPASAFENLFNLKNSGDLSDKLSRQPIADLTKAFAINDRLLYINDLFGKDQNAFVESVRLLDRFQNMAEAKGLLINLADQYNWLDEERSETAQAFVQLVQRRYINQP